MNTTPLRVPLVVAGLGLIGTAFGALGGAWLTQHAGGGPGRATPPGRDQAGPRHRQGTPDQPGRLTVAEIHARIKDVPGFDADTAVWGETRKNGSKGVVPRFSAGMERIRAHDRDVAITIARSWARAHRCQLAATANTLRALAFAIVPHSPHRHVGRCARSSVSRCAHIGRVIRWPASSARW